MSSGFLCRWLVLARTLEPIAGRELAASVQPVIASDLAALGVVQPGDGARPTGVGAPAVTSGQALGTAWVLLGSRLGLRTLGRPMRELTGTDIQLCDSIDAGGLIELRRRIDRRTGDALEAVLRGATSAFTTARDILQGPPWS
jgi:heme oxygenase